VDILFAKKGGVVVNCYTKELNKPYTKLA